MGSLEDFPEQVKSEENGYADVGCEEVCDILVFRKLSRVGFYILVTFQWLWCSPTKTSKPLKTMMRAK